MEKQNTLSFYKELISSKICLPTEGDKLIHPNEGEWLVIRASNCLCDGGYFLTGLKYIERKRIKKADYRDEDAIGRVENISPHDFIGLIHDFVIKEGYEFVPCKNDEKRFVDMIGWSIRNEYLKQQDNLEHKRSSIAVSRLKDLGWSDGDIEKKIQERTDLVNEYFGNRSE